MYIQYFYGVIRVTEKKVPLTGRILVLCGMFSVFALIIFYGIIVLCTQTIYMEDDTVMPIYFKIMFSAVAIVVETGILFMIFPIWKRIIKKTGAMTLTKYGIENTFTIFNFLAFWTIFKINIIPWNAMEFDSLSQTISIERDRLPEGSCNKIAGLLLIAGFNFSIGKITFEEIKAYRDAAVEGINISV